MYPSSEYLQHVSKDDPMLLVGQLVLDLRHLASLGPVSNLRQSG